MKAAFLAFPDCALWQVSLLQMLLKKSGWAIRTLTLGGLPLMTDGGLRLIPDGAVETAAPRDYNLVLMAGGPVWPEYVSDPRLHRFLRQYDGQRGLIAASAQSVVYVAAAGLLGGLQFTTPEANYKQHQSLFLRSFYTGAGVCADGNIISCQELAYREFTKEVCLQLSVSTDFETHSSLKT